MSDSGICSYMYVHIDLYVHVYSVQSFTCNQPSIHCHICIVSLNSELFLPSTWFYLLLQVHSNGYISLQENQGSSSGSSGSWSASEWKSGSGSRFESRGYDITTLFSTMDPLIGVLLTDVDATAVRDVFYQ